MLFTYGVSCGNEIGSDEPNYSDDIIQLCKLSFDVVILCVVWNYEVNSTKVTCDLVVDLWFSI